MEIKVLDYKGDPSRIVGEDYDCLCVAYDDDSHLGPLKSEVLQWVDWKLQGQVSRVLSREENREETMTFVPTMKRIRIPYVALGPREKISWKGFLENCEGLKLERVLVFVENASHLNGVQSALNKLQVATYPGEITVGYEAT